MTHVLAQFVVKPDKRQEFCTAALTLMAQSKVESGCMLYKLVQKVGEQGTFGFVEVWKNETALELHKDTNHYKELVPVLEACSETFNVVVYT